MVDAKLVVTIALFLPVAYIFLEWDFTVWVLAGLAAYAYSQLDAHLINKADAERRPPPALGPRQPFLPPDKDWDIGPDGVPVRQYDAPQQYLGGRRG